MSTHEPKPAADTSTPDEIAAGPSAASVELQAALARAEEERERRRKTGERPAPRKPAAGNMAAAIEEAERQRQKKRTETGGGQAVRYEEILESSLRSFGPVTEDVDIIDESIEPDEGPGLLERVTGLFTSKDIEGLAPDESEVEGAAEVEEKEEFLPASDEDEAVENSALWRSERVEDRARESVPVPEPVAATPTSTNAPQPITLQVAGGGDAARGITFDDPQISLGRRASCLMSFSQEARYVSRHHAVVFRREGGWWLLDAGSRYGTHLNGTRIVTPMRLSTGDRIFMGVLHDDAREGGIELVVEIPGE